MDNEKKQELNKRLKELELPYKQHIPVPDKVIYNPITGITTIIKGK